MSKWTIEMCYGLNICVEGVEANSLEEAIKKAREMVEDDKGEYVDLSELEYECTTYTSEFD